MLRSYNGYIAAFGAKMRALQGSMSLYIYDLSVDAVSSSGCIASNGKII
jgi:hypothetical protein